VTVAMMPRTGEVTLVIMETRVHMDQFEEVFKLAGKAGKIIHNEMKGAVKSRTGMLVAAMESGPRIGSGEEDV
jgi:exosome complex component RRP41